jgi:hypothetical protein
MRSIWSATPVTATPFETVREDFISLEDLRVLPDNLTLVNIHAARSASAVEATILLDFIHMPNQSNASGI